MVRGSCFMAAEVVNRRNRLTSVKRVKAIGPSVRSHQRLAEARWTWSACNRASHTFTSGKLNKVVDLFIGEVERPAAGGGDNGPIEAEAPAGPGGFGLRDGLLDRSQDQLPGGAAPAGGGLMETAMEVAGEINRGADGVGHGLHGDIVEYIL